MDAMRRILLSALIASALTGAAAAPASADILSDLGVSTAGLSYLPAGFDINTINPLEIETQIHVASSTPHPVDRTNATMWDPPVTPIKKSTSSRKASAKKRKSRRARR